jgi:glycosyltransferase involved in cell wall biosynthesis
MSGARHGGAEMFFERLCGALHDAGDAVLPVIRRDPARAALLREAGMMPVELGFGSPIDPLSAWRLRRALRRFAPDVVVSWMNRATRHTPRGPWVHVGRLGGYYPLRHYRMCDHLVGNTHGIVNWLRGSGWPVERTHYLPNFTSDFADAVPAPDLAGDTPLLLGLGRLHTDKGFDTLLRALALLPRCRLALAGEGPERHRLTALAAELRVADRTQFLGWRHDAGSLLRAADVFVCSSRVEPLGNMVIEAWSAGTPVVAVATGGPAELIEDGRTGRLVPPESPERLAEVIRATLSDAPLRARLAASGRARFATQFARPPVLAAWRAFLARLAAAPR